MAAIAEEGRPSGVLQGFVLDRNHQPAEGVTVSLKGTIRQVSTNQKGFFIFANLVQGQYALVVSGVGLQTHEQPV
ncbi:hypothetical protein VF13_39905, partial [Nostoc linckia z16]